MRKIFLAIGVLFAISVCSIASTPDDYNNTVFSEEVSTNPDSLIDLKVYLKNNDYNVKSVQFTIVLPDSVDFVVNGSDYSFNRSYLLTDDWTVSVRTKKGDKPNTAIVLIYNISDINSIIPVGVNELMTLKLKVNHDVASGTKLVEVNQITLTDGDGNEHTDMRMKVSSSIVITMPQFSIKYYLDGTIYDTYSVPYGSIIELLELSDREGYSFSGWQDAPLTMPDHDIAISGFFIPNYYRLSWIVDSVTILTDSVKYGDVLKIIDSPTKEGYTFSGWSEIPSVMPASDVEITGSFSVNSYNLVYTLDGEPYKTLVLNYGSSIIAEPNPIREGYTFSGWSGEPSTMPAGDVEITGFFNINTYNLVYKVDGATYKSLSVIYGNEIIPEVTPVKEGYTFSGWSEIPSTMPAGDVEISGTFSVNSYNLVYIVDGETYKSMTVEYGSSIIAEPEPVKEGSTFSGWSGVPSTMPARDVEITGSFDSNSYKLIYKLDGEIYKSSIVKYGSEITAEPAPVREGYTFSGWSEIPSTMPSSDVEITGTFSVNSYNLVYKIGDEIYKTTIVEYGSSIIAEPNPEKEGYTFSGWSEIPSVMPAGDLVVSGLFSVNYHELRYKIDGEIYKTDSVAYGSTIIAENAPAIVGYIFSGWDGIPVTMPDYDVEVTGSFSVNSYNLVYKVDGIEYRTLTLAYGTEIVAESAPTREGYTFSGWSDIPATMPASDVEVTGSFVVNSYLLTVIVDGEVFYSDSVAYGTTLADYVEMLTDKGIDLSQWEYYGEIDTMVMPAHDVVINALLDAVRPIQTDANRLVVYDLNGKKLEVDDISALPTGIYIINGRKYVLQ